MPVVKLAHQGPVYYTHRNQPIPVIIAFPRRENRPEAQEAADCATSCPQHGDSDSLRPSTNTSIHLADQRDRLHRARSTPPLSSSPSTPNSHFLRRDPQCISNLIFRQ
eukprot:3505578-Rhodomonas_salina.1